MTSGFDPHSRSDGPTHVCCRCRTPLTADSIDAGSITDKRRWVMIACAVIAVVSLLFDVGVAAFFGVISAFFGLLLVAGRQRCPACRSTDLIPANSPRGQELLK